MSEEDMPMPLVEWARSQIVKDEMLWKRAAESQFKTFVDILAPVVGVNVGAEHEDGPVGAFVIATHRSKSITLPVVRMERLDLGIAFTMRNNFYNWKLSVESERPVIDESLPYMFKANSPPDPDYTGDALSSVYFEGFPERLVFGYYSADLRRWSAEIFGDHRMYAVLFACMRAVGGLQRPVYHTRASHRAQLDAERDRFRARTAARKAAGL